MATSASRHASGARSSNEASLGPPRWVAGCRRSVLFISTRQAVRRCPHPPAAAPRNWPLGIGRQATRLSVVTTTVTVNEVLGGGGGPGSGVSGPGLSERLRAQTAGRRAGGQLLYPTIGETDPL